MYKCSIFLKTTKRISIKEKSIKTYFMIFIKILYTLTQRESNILLENKKKEQKKSIKNLHRKKIVVHLHH